MCFQLLSFFVSILPKVPCYVTNWCVLDRLKYFMHVFRQNKSSFWASQIKANAYDLLQWILQFCDPHLKHKYRFSAIYAVYYSIWQVLICLPCRWGKEINIQDHLSVFIQNCHVISFCTTPKDSEKNSTSWKAQRGSLCIHFKQWGFETEVECLIIPHLTQCHCHFITAKMNCLHLFPKVKIMSDIQFFLSLLLMIINQGLLNHRKNVNDENVHPDYWFCPLVHLW